ncbi:MAG: DsbA family protein [Paracoccaceae bacterium]|nr:DsbA family protein [Paracoccaceae bacterium]
MRSVFKIIVILLSGFFSTAWADSKSLNDQIAERKIRDFILNNPEIILESLKLYEEKIIEEKNISRQELIKTELLLSKKNGLDYIGGNPNGTITMIEFLDYRCGYCRKAYREVEFLLRNNSDLRFIIKELPILGEQSVIAAKASIAVLIHHGKKHYESLTEKLLHYNGVINIDSVSILIESVGGNLKDIRTIMDSQTVNTVLNSNYLLAEKLGISGTPTFIIGTEIIRGYKDINTLQELINREKQNL